ncbi:MAG TPA: hypothetical protein VKV29_02110 [Chthonomonas sp.]|uniref:hypothetical protein n=1 Tax=Chthonomonas sp. TaxID=2282153 RepID=UPI002B4B4C50|nr:hypothetical protein [Chthonomonas sp.]HLH79059.1 hypothetical protein [Chthonomonas sp.]
MAWKCFRLTRWMQRQGSLGRLFASALLLMALPLMASAQTPSLSGLTISPTNVTGGNATTGTVFLSAAAPSGGVSVSLSSSAAQVATVPASVSVAAGQTSASFSITTQAVSSQSTVTITATLGNTSQTASFTLYPAQLTSFTLAVGGGYGYGYGGGGSTQLSVTGGNQVTGTVSLDKAAPNGGVSVAISVDIGNSIALPGPVVVPAGQSSTSFTFSTSWVNQPIVTHLTATLGNTLTDTLTLNPGNLRVVQVKPPNQVQLQWDATASGPNFVLERNGQVIATLSNTTNTYTDTIPNGFQSGTFYYYQLYDTTPSGGLGQELSAEKVGFQVNVAQDNQTVDSRIDPRYATLHYLNYCFGHTTYRGGLFVGYATDPARIARSFVRFGGLSAPATGSTFRWGAVALYSTGAYTTQNQQVSVKVGCQVTQSSNWSGATIVWTTQPDYGVLNPANAENVQTVTYSPTVGAPGWQFWPLQEIKLVSAAGNPLSVAFCAPDETQYGWVYFAKIEYGSATAPCIPNAWDLPIPLTITFPTPVPQSVVQCTIGMNGVGLNDTSTVQVQVVVTDNYGYVSTVNETVQITGLNHTFTITDPKGGLVAHVQVTATCNGVSAYGQE